VLCATAQGAGEAWGLGSKPVWAQGVLVPAQSRAEPGSPGPQCLNWNRPVQELRRPVPGGIMIVMDGTKHYSRAPITEAVIDLRVEPPPGLTLASLAEVQSGERETYPTRRDMFRAQADLSIGAQVGAAVAQVQNGYAFESADGRQIFQARLDGFLFSRLAPYDRWETFRNEARRLWQIYQAITRPQGVSRAAVRYINRLDLPLPLTDFRDYLRTVPEIAAELPQGLTGYFMQLQIPQEDLGSMLLLNEAMMPPSGEDLVSVLLDIDLSRPNGLPSAEEDLWKFIEELHVRKNEIFEACITDRTRELIA
jgi:uncharacterized protein (TIGR04255 family)